MELHASRPFRQGDIYWLDNCEPLHGDVAKRRPVIVISTPFMVSQHQGKLVVVACTSTVYPDDVEAIELPSFARVPRTHTGLMKRTWAVPSWFLVVGADRLEDRIGYISGKLLEKVLGRFIVHYQRSEAKDPA